MVNIKQLLFIVNTFHRYANFHITISREPRYAISSSHCFLMAEVRYCEQIKTVLYNYPFLTALNKIKKLGESLMISAVHAVSSEESMSLPLFALQFSLLISKFASSILSSPRRDFNQETQII